MLLVVLQTESSWVPTRYHDGTSEINSGLDSDSDAWAKQQDEQRKNVRFSRVSEVRQLCGKFLLSPHCNLYLLFPSIILEANNLLRSR
jgi:hypothetical protein